MDTDQVEANWLSQDPDAWDWLNQANQHPDPSNWTEQWLVAELAVKHHDSDALALLRKYYYRQNLLAWMAYRLDPKGGWTFRKQLTNAACVLLRCIFEIGRAHV